MINENFEALNRQPYIESNVGFYESSSNFSKPPIVNINKPEICLKIFKSNNLFGLLIYINLLFGKILI